MTDGERFTDAVALLVATFAILPHTRGTTGITSATATATTATTATASPQAPACAPDQITLTRPDHTELYQIDMTSPTDGWALGRTWSQVNSDNPTSHPLLLRFHQCHWTPAPDPLPGADISLRDISMATAEDGWATGYETIGANSHCVLLHYTDGQWQRAPLPPQMQGQSKSICEHVRMASSEEGWLLGQWGDTSRDVLARQLLHYVNGGWTQIESPVLDLFDLTTTGPDDLWAAGTRYPAPNDPDHEMKVIVAHYRHGQWTTFPLAVGAGLAWFHMDSPTDGWLVPAVLPLRVLHYEGTSWRQSSFSEHVPAGGVASVFDSGDAWNIELINGEHHPEVAGMQHYVNGQWQTVQWPFSDIFVRPPLTRTVPGQYWTVGVRAIGADWRTWKWVLLYYAGGAWHEYGA